MSQPVPPEDLLDEGEGRAVAEAAGQHPGIVRSLGLGLASNVPGAQFVAEQAENARLSDEDPGMQARSVLGPLGTEREELLARQQNRPAATERGLPLIFGLRASEQRMNAEQEAARTEHPVAYNVGAWGPAVAGLLGGPLRRLAGRVASSAAPAFAHRAEQAAQQLHMNPAGWGALEAEQGPQRPEQVARAVLDELGTAGRDPRSIRAGLRDALDRWGSSVDALTQEAGRRGGTFNLQRVVARFRDEVKPEMLQNPRAAPLADAVESYLNGLRPAEQRAGTNVGRTFGDLTPAQGWQLRRNLDQDLRGIHGTLDPESTLSKSYFNRLRGIVSDELGQAHQATRLGAPWATANERYGALRDAEDIVVPGVRKLRAEETALPSRPGAPLRILGVKVPGSSVGGATSSSEALREAGRRMSRNETWYDVLRAERPPTPWTPAEGPASAGLGAHADDPRFYTWRPGQNEPPLTPVERPPLPPTASAEPASAGPTLADIMRAREEARRGRETAAELVRRQGPPMPKE